MHKHAVTQKPTVILPDESDTFDFGGLGVEWKIGGPDTGERFAIIHHPIAPRALAAPLHYHHNEDEYSYVLEGTLGALLGDEVVEAGPGTWVYKPREQWLPHHRSHLASRIRELLPRGGRRVGGHGGICADQREVCARHGLRERPRPLRALRIDVP